MKKWMLTIVGVILISVTSKVAADEPYDIVTEWSKGTGGGGVFIVEDIDNDGKIEAVIGNSSGFLNTLELNNGKWVEQWKAFLNDWNVSSAKVGDLDGDGIKEIIASTNNINNGAIRILNAMNGESLFRGGPSFNREVVARELIDVNKDGNLEILIHDYNHYALITITKPYNLNYFSTLWSSYAYTTNPIFIDIDNDGVIEIITANDTWDPNLRKFTGHTISIYDGVIYQLEWQDTTLDGLIMALTTGDLDNDGVIEIATVTYSFDKTIEYINVYDGITKELEWTDGGRSFRDDPGWPGFRRKFIIADVDNDGINELINNYQIIDYPNQFIKEIIEIYNGQTKALEGTIEREGVLWDILYVLDIDGDGAKDIVCTNGYNLTVFDGTTRSEKLNIIIPATIYSGVIFTNIDQDPQLEVVSTSDLTTIDGKTGVLENEGYLPPIHYATGDIDGDGIKEILLTEARNGVTFRIFDGITKAEKSSFSIPDATASSDFSYLFLGDMDGDGSEEIFFGTSPGYSDVEDKDYIIDGVTKEMIWQGQIEWVPKKIVDIDNDGQLEIVSYSFVRNPETKQLEMKMYVYNLETKAIEWEIPGIGDFVDILDVDSDGAIEIIRGTPNTSWQSKGYIYLIDTQSHEIEWSLENVAEGIEGIAISDVDNDGVYEILYGTYGGRIYILDGITKVVEGTFDKLDYHHGLAVGDVDNDGKNEIVATDGWNDWNYLYIFDGITYNQKWKSSMSLGEEAHSIKILDVDSDGIYEIIVQSNGYLHILGFNRAPVFDPIGDKKIDEDKLLEFTVSATDPEGAAVIYSAKNLPAAATFTNQVFKWVPNYDQAGTYPITFIASDGRVSASETINITVNNVNRAPIINKIPDQIVYEGQELRVTINAHDPDKDAITYSMTNAPTGATIDPQTGLFKWRPDYEQAGNYVVTFTANDGNLSAGETINITVNNVNQAPKVDTIPSLLKGISRPNRWTQFTTVYTDPDGYNDLVYGRFLINTSVNAAKCFYASYDVASNKIYLINDNGTNWVGGFSPGSANIIKNSYAGINCAETTVEKQGSTVTIKWSIAFRETMSGRTYNCYLLAKDKAGNMGPGWVKKGTWRVTWW